MALRKTLSFDSESITKVNGFIASREKSTVEESCYIKVEDLMGTKEEISFNISIAGASFAMKKSFTFSPDMGGPNFIKQAYLYLKSLGDYQGAEDC